MIGRFRQQLRRRTPLGWLQLRHHKTRLLVAMAGIAFADILIFMQLGFRGALFDTNTGLQRSLEADLVLISPRAIDLTRLYTFPRRRLLQAMDVPGVKSVEALYVSSLDWKNPQTQQKTPMLVVGQNPSKPAFDLPAVNRQLSALKKPDTLLFDAASRGNYSEAIARLQAGETITSEIDRITVTIAGTFNLGASFAVDGTLIASQQTFLRLFTRWQAGTVSMGKIELEPGTDPEVIRAALNEYLPDDVHAFTHAEYIDFELNYWNTRTPIGFIFGLGSAMGFIVGVVIVYQVLSTDVNAHLSEYATFKAMGYRDRYLLGVVFEEAIILAVLGFVPGVAVSTGLYALTRKATALPIVLPLGRVVFVFALTIVMCGFSGAIATRRLRSADPADIF
ncbi:MAG: FtsX-like permease family protein [Hormoscilla sp. GUM202]|nr:FtsX-like permease family protein [Hormoscilla sp. GUM202]